MDNDFITEDGFDAKRLEDEKKKQKKLEKKARLLRKAEAIRQIQKQLNLKTDIQIEDFQNCLNTANLYKRGTDKWALAILNLPEDICFQEIRKKYLKLAQNWHPDKNNATNCDAMKYLNEAWQTLKMKAYKK